MSEVWCTLDFETASNTKGSICEAGISVFDYSGKHIESWSSYVRPPGNSYSTEFVERVGSIKPHQTADAPPWEEVSLELEARTAGMRIVCHNLAFDLTHWQAAAKRVRGNIPDQSWFACSLRVARALFPHLKSHKLGDTASYFGLEHDTSLLHNAKEDAYICGKVWDAMSRTAFKGDPDAVYNLFKYHASLHDSEGRIAGQMGVAPPSKKQVDFALSLMASVSHLNESPCPQNPDMFWPPPAANVRKAWLESLDKNRVSNIISELLAYPPPTLARQEEFREWAEFYCQQTSDYGTCENRGDGTWTVSFLGVDCLSREEPDRKKIVESWMRCAGEPQYAQVMAEIQASCRAL